MPIHWIVRVGDGSSFKSSLKKGIWSLKSTTTYGKNFMKNAKEGDILWFLTNSIGGRKFIAVSTLIKMNKRVLGPLIPTTFTNEDLGWTGDWDYEVHFKNLYDIEKLNICPNILARTSYLNTKSIQTTIDFEKEHANIVKYSPAVLIHLD